jgi:hypothetical protein
MSVFEHLKLTKEILLERGRCGGELVEQDGKCCLLGAVGLAVFGDDWDPAYTDLEKFDAARVISALSAFVPNMYTEDLIERLWRFNDRNKSDDVVFAVLDKAIEAA